MPPILAAGPVVTAASGLYFPFFHHHPRQYSDYLFYLIHAGESQLQLQHVLLGEFQLHSSSRHAAFLSHCCQRRDIPGAPLLLSESQDETADRGRKQPDQYPDGRKAETGS
ncbi:hypothetical protein BGW36DRAFT_363644 [Talaromyces proteolyticus]|uniref:Uncharacterized protein n=1 Tax=Talaromyces proteolyticus TaxID=1131652 RepID=A0AAD4PSH1_9EURO|nr:uncharacterized protein BGW36DRAFT_363644 [Talaromyces proteolyticus]KAH8691311.1 hypothetical protein BGW36DRAFT_363644 [Talaromyces proteolyticus]